MRRYGARALLVAAVVAGAWMASQACVLLLQSARAHQQQQALARGESAWRWDFATASAMVGPGSDGLQRAQRDDHGLRIALASMPLDLSLSLHGRVLALDRLTRARISIDTEADLQLSLLAAGQPRARAEPLATAVVGPAQDVVEIDLRSPLTRAQVLRLRLEAPPDELGMPPAAGSVVLRSLELVSTGAGCAPGTCAEDLVRLAPRASPEQFLRARDRLLQSQPMAIADVAGVPRPLAAGLARLIDSPYVSPVALLLALVVFAWALRARRLQEAGRPLQLLVLFAVPVALLALGRPGAEPDITAAAAFLLCCAAALLHPGGRQRWQWLGDADAWRSAARVTVAGVAVLALLILADRMFVDGAAAVDGALVDGGGRFEGALVEGGRAEVGGSAWEWRPQRMPRYLAWAALQQALLLLAISPRMRQLTRDPVLAAIGAGALFSLLHLPNFVLMLATLAAGIAWSRSGMRHGALLPLVLSHWLLGTLLASTAPTWVLRGAEVGGRFLMPG